MARHCFFTLILTLSLAIWANTNPIVNNSNSINRKVICYYDSSAYYRTGSAKFTVENIDSSLCTHVVYAFFGVSDDNQIEVLDTNLQNDLHDIQNFVAHNENKAKSLIAIGGPNIAVSKFSHMASNDEGRVKFAESVMSFLRHNKFDGVVIDWEFPNTEDIESFVKLLDKFDELMAHTNFELGISVSPRKFQIDAGYDVSHFVNFVDFVNVLTYDYSGPWANMTDHSSPLHSADNLNSQASSLDYWHQEKGVPKEKLILSLPLFGRTWKLFNAQNIGRGALAEGPGAEGPLLKQSGLLAYNELCFMMNTDPQLWTQFYDSKAEAVYAVHNQQWVSFENIQTVTAKGKFVEEMGFGGVSLFALSYDDFSGVCGEKFGLLNAVNRALRSDFQNPVTETVTETATEASTESSTETVTETATEASTETSTETASVTATETVTETVSETITKISEPTQDIFKCHRNGYFRDYNDCRKWYTCSANELEEMIETTHFCEKGFAFDENSGTCNNKELVKGCEHEVQS